METLVVAKVVLVNAEGKILQLRRSESDVRRPLEWDIPGGHTEGNEFAAEAAARETLEEAGIAVDPHSLKLSFAMTEAVSEERSVTWLFFVGYTTKTDVVLSHEHVEFAWVSLGEAIAKIDYGRQKRALAYIAENKLAA